MPFKLRDPYAIKPTRRYPTRLTQIQLIRDMCELQLLRRDYPLARRAFEVMQLAIPLLKTKMGGINCEDVVETGLRILRGERDYDDEFVRFLRSVLAKYSSQFEDPRENILLEITMSMIKSNKLRDASGELESYIIVSPYKDDVKLQLVYGLMEMKQYYETRMRYETMGYVNDQGTESRYFRRAINHFKQACLANETNNDEMGLFWIVQMLKDEKRYNEAISLINDYICKNPENSKSCSVSKMLLDTIGESERQQKEEEWFLEAVKYCTKNTGGNDSIFGKLVGEYEKKLVKEKSGTILQSLTQLLLRRVCESREDMWLMDKLILHSYVLKQHFPSLFSAEWSSDTTLSTLFAFRFPAVYATNLLLEGSINLIDPKWMRWMALLYFAGRKEYLPAFDWCLASFGMVG
ncbi:uncharacterized protein VTP21DRAFT_3660 [Calcarisporiella thermophila]|uniref:uncharacterized protein n=1 Tax=Calcarisporiella thermophila TaxID=911321 RepID=UPI003743B7F2